MSSGRKTFLSTKRCPSAARVRTHVVVARVDGVDDDDEVSSGVLRCLLSLFQTVFGAASHRATDLSAPQHAGDLQLATDAGGRSPVAERRVKKDVVLAEVGLQLLGLRYNADYLVQQDGDAHPALLAGVPAHPRNPAA